MKFRILLMAAIVACFGANAANAAIALPPTTYTFSGLCSDCTGFGTGTLVLQNYNLGNAFSTSNFVSWSYHSDLVQYSLSLGQETSFTGSLSSIPGDNTVFIGSNLYNFSSSSQGNWNVSPPNQPPADFGPTSLWTAAVPEPLTLSLFGAGLAGMTALRRRKKAAA